MYAIRITSPSIIVCVKKERCGITFLYGYQNIRRNPHLLYALLYVSKSGVKNVVPTKKPIAKVNKNQNLLIHTKRAETKQPEGILSLFSYAFFLMA